MSDKTNRIAENDRDFLRRLKRLLRDFEDRELSPAVDALAPTAAEVEASLKAVKDRAARAGERERLRVRLAELDDDATASGPAAEPEAPAPPAEPPSAMLGEIAAAVTAANAPAAPKDDGRKAKAPKA